MKTMSNTATGTPRALPGANRARTERGFTLIELLIVVSVIAILASIAVPNFLEAQVRARVSRAKADMRTIATALESYHVDNNNYPPRNKEKSQVPLLNERLREMSRLTTPIAYITSLPIDVFERHIAPPNNVLDYFDPQQVANLINTIARPLSRHTKLSASDMGWLLISVGPDGYLGPGNTATGYPLPQPGDAAVGQIRYSVYYPYDPTNGTVSVGNIYRCQNDGLDQQAMLTTKYMALQ